MYVLLDVCRANAQQPKLFVGMILILIFAEALALYGLIGKSPVWLDYTVVECCHGFCGKAHTHAWIAAVHVHTNFMPSCCHTYRVSCLPVQLVSSCHPRLVQVQLLLLQLKKPWTSTYSVSLQFSDSVTASADDCPLGYTHVC